METKITCTSCGEELNQKKIKGKIIGSVIGGGTGAALASGLGIAGAVAGMAVAAPATIAGLVLIGALGNRLGNDYDRKSALKCRRCNSNKVK